jgi:uncharacterized membrane protein
MKRMPSVLAATGLGFLTLAATPLAHAWTAIGNATPSTVFVVYAHERVTTCNVGCAASSGGAAWFNEGWWQIAPGGVVTVNGGHHHAANQAFFAEDDFGRVWAGNRASFCVPFTAFDMCGHECPSGSRFLGYRHLGWNIENKCCHGLFVLCTGPDNFQTNLTL